LALRIPKQTNNDARSAAVLQTEGRELRDLGNNLVAFIFSRRSALSQ